MRSTSFGVGLWLWNWLKQQSQPPKNECPGFFNTIQQVIHTLVVIQQSSTILGRVANYSKLICKDTKNGCIPKMGRDIIGRRHAARKPKHQNYNPRQLLRIYTPTIQWYMTRFDSDAVNNRHRVLIPTILVCQ